MGAKYSLIKGSNTYDSVVINGEEYNEAWTLIGGEKVLIWKKGKKGGGSLYGFFDSDGNQLLAWFDKYYQYVLPHGDKGSKDNTVCDYMALVIHAFTTSVTYDDIRPNINKIVFSPEVEYMGPQGFSYQDNRSMNALSYIKEIKFSPNLKQINIQSTANILFYNCNGLTNIIFPKSLSLINYEKSHNTTLIYNCKSLKRIEFEDYGDDDLIISGGIFALGCSKLEYIKMPSNLKSIEGCIVDKCKPTDGMIIDLSETKLTKINYKFINDSWVKELLLPETIIEYEEDIFISLNYTNNNIRLKELYMKNCHDYTKRLCGSGYNYINRIIIPDNSTIGNFMEYMSIKELIIRNNCEFLGNISIRPSSIYFSGENYNFNDFHFDIDSFPLGSKALENFTISFNDDIEDFDTLRSDNTDHLFRLNHHFHSEYIYYLYFRFPKNMKRINKALEYGNYIIVNNMPNNLIEIPEKVEKIECLGIKLYKTYTDKYPSVKFLDPYNWYATDGNTKIQLDLTDPYSNGAIMEKYIGDKKSNYYLIKE